MTDKKPEPIERQGIRVYDCPLCNDRIIGTLEQAKAHVNIPLGRGVVLPKGFVFGMDYNKTFNRKSTTIYHVLRPKQLDSFTLRSARQYCELGIPKACETLTTHDFIYGLEVCDYQIEPSSWVTCEVREEYSNVLQEDFRKGIYFLLTEEQFAEFRTISAIPERLQREMKRTVDGIEKLLSPSTYLPI